MNRIAVLIIVFMHALLAPNLARSYTVDIWEGQPMPGDQFSGNLTL